MIHPNESQLKEIEQVINANFKKLEKLCFEDIALDKLKNHNFRKEVLTPLDIIALNFGKAASAQKDSIDCILGKLKLSHKISIDVARSSIEYRTGQIDPNKYLKFLLKCLAPKPSANHVKVIFDGTNIQAPDNSCIGNKYSKPKVNAISGQYPIVKEHHLITLKDHICLGSIMSDIAVSERVGLCQLAIELSKEKHKLYIIADRGLYGATVGFLLEKHHHKYAIRLCPKTMKSVKHNAFKDGSTVVEMSIRKKSIAAYKHLDPDLLPEEYSFRVVRKKGNSKGLPSVYIMTNDYDTPADEILGEYRNRQRIEDHFKYLKSYGGMAKIHFNTGVRNVEMIIATLVYYLSILEMVLFQLLETPRPDEKGCYTINRATAWKLFFECFKMGFNSFEIVFFCVQVLSKLIKIRPGRKAHRYTNRVRKCKR